MKEKGGWQEPVVGLVVHSPKPLLRTLGLIWIFISSHVDSPRLPHSLGTDHRDNLTLTWSVPASHMTSFRLPAYGQDSYPTAKTEREPTSLMSAVL